ncbi:MAG TPA: hypothetical protein VL970_04785 [Candidatus Acidoferrales bacterium]|nr:hypothetical protein [Candidatus Acidoferrales bacterium]
MKNDSTTTFLNLVLAALVFLGVLFALLAIWHTRDLRRAQPLAQAQLMAFQSNFARVQALVTDTMTYNARVNSPELTQILQSIQTPPAVK